jgi:hypothetical protein
MSLPRKVIRHFRPKDELWTVRRIINWILFILTSGLFVLAILDIGFPSANEISKFQVHNFYFRVCYTLIGLLYIVRAVFFHGGQRNRKVFAAQLVLGAFLVLFSD